VGKKVEKTRASGTKTEKGFMTHIVSVLRNGSKRWTPKWQVMNDGREQRLNTRTGKMKYGNTCNECKDWFFTDELEIDHIVPFGTYLDRTNIETFAKTIGKYILGMYCETDNLQRLCKTCHLAKTAEEKSK
jgi:5-methylcytosine-specific restriction endonuclease McrA